MALLFAFFGLLFASTNVNGQITYCEEFDQSNGGWSENSPFDWSQQNDCSLNISGAMDATISSGTAPYVSVSPIIGVSRGGAYDIHIGFDYFYSGALLQGSYLRLEYSTSSNGPWTQIYEVNSSNHIVSSSCNHVSVPPFILAKGASLYLRFVTNDAFVFDNVFAMDLCLLDRFNTRCWGIVKSPYTWYRGLSQWMWIRAKGSNGIGTYQWSISGPASLVLTPKAHEIYIFQATGPVTVDVTVSLGTYCYSDLSFSIAYDDSYWGGTTTDPWLLKICEGGISSIVPYNTAKQKVCIDGTATLGVCTPKTDISSNSDVKVKIYPNPVNSNFTIDIYTLDKSGSIQMFDLAGQLVLAEKFVTNAGVYTRFMDASSLSTGVYILRVTTENKTVSEKVFVQ